MKHGSAFPKPITDSICEVIPFPAKKRVGKIRRTAEVLFNRSGRSAECYWRQVRDGMVSQMERAGLPPDVIDLEVRDFFNAVQMEMRLFETFDGGGAA